MPGATPAAATSFVSHQSQGGTPAASADTPEAVNNPVPSIGAVPSVAAAQSAPVPGSGGNIWTPPQTPSGGNHGTAGGMHSAASSVSGIGPLGLGVAGLARRESDADSVVTNVAQSIEAPAGQGTKREGEEIEKDGRKKRRVQPTLVEEH